MADIKEVYDHFLGKLIGDEQKKLVNRIKDNWGKDEESASLTNRLLDQLEAELGGKK